MSPEECIGALDSALADDGEDVVLRRFVGAANIDVKVRASVRAFRPEELIGGISQTDSLVTLSPTQIKNAQWPGGQPVVPGRLNDIPWMPKNNDRAIIQRRNRAVTFVKPFAVGGEIVRIELTVAG